MPADETTLLKLTRLLSRAVDAWEDRDAWNEDGRAAWHEGAVSRLMIHDATAAQFAAALTEEMAARQERGRVCAVFYMEPDHPEYRTTRVFVAGLADDERERTRVADRIFAAAARLHHARPADAR